MLQDVVMPETYNLSGYAPADVVEATPEVKRTLASLGRHSGHYGCGVRAGLRRVAGHDHQEIYAALSYQISTAAGALVNEAIEPMIAALNESQSLLRGPPPLHAASRVWRTCRPMSTRPGRRTPTSASPNGSPRPTTR